MWKCQRRKSGTRKYRYDKNKGNDYDKCESTGFCCVFSFRPGHSEDITEAEMNLRAATKQHSGRGRGSGIRKAQSIAGRKKQAKRLR